MRRNHPGSYLYGPVPSRRLGLSLGVDIIPFKTCSLDCIYCQLGRGSQKAVSRKDFYSAEDVLLEIKQTIESGTRVDFITFSGSGEPTLNSQIGLLIRKIKSFSAIPVAVLTNSTLLREPAVRQALLPADLVVPSLDAVTQDVFEKINRPHPSLRIEDVIRSLKDFRTEFAGKIWIEILLVRGVNDDKAHLDRMRNVIRSIGPDKIQLNTVVRPPAEKSAAPLSYSELEKIREFFGAACEIIAPFDNPSKIQRHGNQDTKEILTMVRRRPMTTEDLSVSLGKPLPETLSLLRTLHKRNIIKKTVHKGKAYYEPNED